MWYGSLRDPSPQIWQDFEFYAPLPPAAVRKRDKERAASELVELAGRASDAHIAALPPSHRQIVRMLRDVHRQAEHQQAVREAEAAAGGAAGCRGEEQCSGELVD